MKKAKIKAKSRITATSRKTTVNPPSHEDEMLDDYSFLDWSKAERGKYAKRYAEGTNVMLIAPDVLDVFPNAESINQVLRPLADLIRASSQTKTTKRTAQGNE